MAINCKGKTYCYPGGKCECDEKTSANKGGTSGQGSNPSQTAPPVPRHTGAEQ
jgi:hypothetical protein